MNDELYQTRDHVAFLHRSRGRMLDELEALDAVIKEAEMKLEGLEYLNTLGDFIEDTAGEDDPDGPVVVTVP